MDFLTFILLLDSTLRLSTPLLLACLAGLFSERSGVFDIGLEGKMLIAAFVAATVAYLTGSVWLGLLGAIVSSVAMSVLHGLAAITFRGNQLISGVAINFLAAGLTVLVSNAIFGQGGRTPGLPEDARFPTIVLPGALTRIPEIRQADPLMQIWSELLSGHTVIVPFTLLLVPATWWLLYRTRFGLRLRAVGENPAAVDTAGVSVVRLRWIALGIAGILCGIAGAYLSTAIQASFIKNMTADRGYLALAALIFAKWKPWNALVACLLFGFLQALETQTRAVNDLIGVALPSQFYNALPFILTVVILAGFVGKAIPPRAGGEPYVKER
ncbi:MAG: ABC transporter permease [Rubellimicrobium sp.]|nr:ABC transporter permease [Rubellimicrobium sp.]